MVFTENDILLVTGASGLVGSHVCQTARGRGVRTRAIIRESARDDFLKQCGVETVIGDLTDQDSLRAAIDGTTCVVHCAAKVGDWGPVEDYRRVNVGGTQSLIEECQTAGSVKRFVHVSSLGVCQARDHYGTDETEPPNATGIDGYTVSKAETELLVRERIDTSKFPAVILRPGFIYGPRDRTVLPRIFERLKSKQFKFLGSGKQLLNNTFVSNLVDAIFLAIERDDCVGKLFHITDGQLVSKREFITTIAMLAELPVPTKSVPLPVARAVAQLMETTSRLLGKTEAPLLCSARIKFLGLNLDFCIDKARRELGYQPKVEFTDGMRETVEWCRAEGLLES